MSWLSIEYYYVWLENRDDDNDDDNNDGVVNYLCNDLWPFHAVTFSPLVAISSSPSLRFSLDRCAVAFHHSALLRYAFSLPLWSDVATDNQWLRFVRKAFVRATAAPWGIDIPISGVCELLLLLLRGAVYRRRTVAARPHVSVSVSRCYVTGSTTVWLSICPDLFVLQYEQQQRNTSVFVVNPVISR